MFINNILYFNTAYSGFDTLRRDLSSSIISGNKPRPPVLFVALFVCTLVFSAKCYALQVQPTPTIYFGYSELAPYVYTSDEGIAAGEFTDIVKKVVVESGHKFVTVSQPNRRLVKSLLTDKHDLGMGISVKKEGSEEQFASDKLVFGEKAFGVLNLTVFWIEGSAPPIDNLNQLQNKALITLTGYNYGGLFMEGGLLANTERFLSETNPRALKALVLERAPYMLHFEKPVLFYWKPYPNVKLSSFTVESLPVVLVMRRSYPNAEKVLKELETLYEELFPERFRALNPP